MDYAKSKAALADEASDLSPFYQHDSIEEIRLRGSSVESLQEMGICPNGLLLNLPHLKKLSRL